MYKAKENVVVRKTEAFTDRIIKMYGFILKERTHNKTSLRQIYKSGTSIGANIAESQYAQSKADFFTKLSIALKEANETRYWLGVLKCEETITENEYDSMLTDIEEIIKLLTSITASVKKILQN